MLAAFPLLSFSPPVLTGSKICSSGSSATSRLYCRYFVTLARLLLLPCYYPYKKQTILYIAADNFLDHDLILFRIYIYYIYIYSASGGVLEGDDGLLQVGTNAFGIAQPCPCLPIPGFWHREPIYVTLFLAQRSPERFGTVLQTSGTVRNGSADINFARRYFSTASKPPQKTVKSSSSCFAFSNLPKSRTVAPRAKATRERSQKTTKEGNFSA